MASTGGTGTTLSKRPAGAEDSGHDAGASARSSKKLKKEPKYPVVNDVEAMIATLKGVDRDTALMAYGMPKGIKFEDRMKSEYVDDGTFVKKQSTLPDWCFVHLDPNAVKKQHKRRMCISKCNRATGAPAAPSSGTRDARLFSFSEAKRTLAIPHALGDWLSVIGQDGVTINTRLMKAKRKVVENEVVFGKRITFDLPHSTQEKIATLYAVCPPVNGNGVFIHSGEE